MNILIISPQSWEGLQLSKHHYARTLSKQGNKVYFLEPPLKWNPFKKRASKYFIEQVFVLRTTLLWPLRISPWFIKKYILRNWAECVLKSIESIDIVWCFDNYSGRIVDLNWFGGLKKVLHVVDNSQEMSNYDLNADIIFGVSQSILREIRTDKLKVLILHGLHEFFLEICNFTNKPDESIIRVGYFGNLSFNAIDYDMFNKLFLLNRGIEWHFWGKLDEKKENMLSDYVKFENNLKILDNVFYHGLKSSNDLVKDVIDIGVNRLICLYKPEYVEKRGGNSHKILEYLSFGYPVISNFISAYKNISILKMPNNENELWEPKDIERLLLSEDWNIEASLIQKKFASGSSYEKRVKQCSNYIEAL